MWSRCRGACESSLKLRRVLSKVVQDAGGPSERARARCIKECGGPLARCLEVSRQRVPVTPIRCLSTVGEVDRGDWLAARHSVVRRARYWRGRETAKPLPPCSRTSFTEPATDSAGRSDGAPARFLPELFFDNDTRYAAQRRRCSKAGMALTSSILARSLLIRHFSSFATVVSHGCEMVLGGSCPMWNDLSTRQIEVKRRASPSVLRRGRPPSGGTAASGASPPWSPPRALPLHPARSNWSQVALLTSICRSAAPCQVATRRRAVVATLRYCPGAPSPNRAPRRRPGTAQIENNRRHADDAAEARRADSDLNAFAGVTSRVATHKARIGDGE